MAIRVYNAAEVAADLFGRTLGTTELEILLGDNAAWDTQATLWMYDPTSTALDNWTGSALTSTVIKPTSITHPAPGRWLKKQNVANASGTTAQYIRGDGSLATFPTAPGKRIETYLGTTDGSGNYTVTYGTAFSSTPDVQPQLQSGTTSQLVRITSTSTTGFTVQVTNRASVTLLGIEVLLAATTAVSGASVGVLVTQR